MLYDIFSSGALSCSAMSSEIAIIENVNPLAHQQWSTSVIKVFELSKYQSMHVLIVEYVNTEGDQRNRCSLMTKVCFFA